MRGSVWQTWMSLRLAFIAPSLPIRVDQAVDAHAARAPLIVCVRAREREGGRERERGGGRMGRGRGPRGRASLHAAGTLLQSSIRRRS